MSCLHLPRQDDDVEDVREDAEHADKQRKVTMYRHVTLVERREGVAEIRPIKVDVLVAVAVVVESHAEQQVWETTRKDVEARRQVTGDG